ncbi:signal peptidase II [Candidatus Peribacteria bacterium]|nr:signal peptidase II [Candidatus Peribacteria bacterium]
MRLLLIAAIAGVGSALASFGAEHLENDILLFGNFVRLTLSHNPDIAFGIPLPFPLKELLIAGALVAVLILSYKERHKKLPALGFGLIIGGAIANLIDRIPDGIVTDYIAIGTFPVFNLPDACITIGAGILLLENLVKKKYA